MSIQGGRIGSFFNSLGNTSPMRSGHNGELIVGTNKGRYAEAAERGELFVASTAVAGVAPGTALSTTPPFAIHNPVGSGVLVSILEIAVGYVSGTLGAGSIVHAENPQATVPSGGTALTANGLKLGVAAGTATVHQGSTLSGTPTILRPTGIVLGASLASTAGLPVVVKEDVGGGILIPAGQAWCLSGVAAAGTSPLVMFSAVWQEIPQS